MYLRPISDPDRRVNGGPEAVLLAPGPAGGDAPHLPTRPESSLLGPLTGAPQPPPAADEIATLVYPACQKKPCSSVQEVYCSVGDAAVCSVHLLRSAAVPVWHLPLSRPGFCHRPGLSVYRRRILVLTVLRAVTALDGGRRS